MGACFSSQPTDQLDAKPASTSPAAVRPTGSPPASTGRPNDKEPLADSSRYEKIKFLAKGANGFVQLALEKATQREVAIKFIPRGSGVIKQVEREIMNHRLCMGHPHIVQFQEVFLTPKYLGIVIEYCPGGDMADFVAAAKAMNKKIKGLSERKARQYFQQLVVAIDFCHRVGVANRDIKLENCLLDGANPPQLKLCDFGHSKDELGDSQCKTVCGTPEYVAPEILLYNKYDGRVADIWSCGVMLYVMLTGQFPFLGKDDKHLDAMARLQRMFPRIVKAEFEMPQTLSAPCKDILRLMLTADSAQRITLSKLMEHPWFLQDLPQPLLDINKNLLAVPNAKRFAGCKQSEAEVLRITAAGAKAQPSEGSGRAATRAEKLDNIDKKLLNLK